ncbi:hypothetical protein FHS39_002516 [Streptomyces olivoverticillatus]|uniref:Uncharacterized protein n=1 Tax=Streptomyces olivoverticillatus TaxID=66427 RepID=A0A7W7LNH5_9ACTN|nr:hypothetical protein [Streptomyces olivoverticillatus]MBB4893485.1 hypothetical protein [Streptomyces olivoverticillatus]
MISRSAYIAGLRAIADWLDAHPEAPAPTDDRVLVPLHTNAAVSEAARSLGVTEVYDSEGNASFDVPFGPIGYRAYGYVDFAAHCALHDERHARRWADQNGMTIQPSDEALESGVAS